MRTVSFFGPDGGEIVGGGTEADNGREAVGGLGGGKKFVEEIFPGGDSEGEGTGGVPVSRTGNWIRTVCCGFALGSDGFVTGGCGNWMRTVSFFGCSGSAIGVGELIRNRRRVTTQSYQRNFLLFNSPFGGPTRLNVPRVTWPPLPREGEGEGEGDFHATRLRASTPHPDPLPFPRGEA